MGNSHSSGARIDASQRDLRNIISATTTNHIIVTLLGVVVLAGLVFYYLHLERRKRITRRWRIRNGQWRRSDRV